MLITALTPTVEAILSGVCLYTPEENTYSVAFLPTGALRNLATVLTQPKYRGQWSVSFDDAPPTKGNYAALTAGLDEKTAQSFLLSPDYIGESRKDLIHFLEAVYRQPVTPDNCGRVAQLFRFWYAMNAPAEYHNPPETPPTFAELTLYDTPAKRNARTQRREARLSELLVAAGWDGKSELLTAFINGVVQVPANPARKDC